MPRTRTSSEAPSARSTRSTRSRGSAGISVPSESASTRASSTSSSGMPEDGMADAAHDAHLYGDLQAQAAEYVNLVHMDHMTRYLQSPEAQQGLDQLLDIVKQRDGGPQSPDYQSALSELDYLEGLFKKLRFSYKEQLTKETVVRRILELELPLLSASDIDAMVQDTEAERQRLRAIKNVAKEQGATAEAMTRALVQERRYVATAEAEMAALPDRLLHLRHRLVRMKLALRSELQSLDGGAAGVDANGVLQTAMQSPSLSTPFSCTRCHRQFHTEAFQQLHQALHNASKNSDGSLNLSDDTPLPASSLRKCRGCDQQVPARFLTQDVPSGETHEAFHARVQREVTRAQQALARETTLSDEDVQLREETEEIVVKLQVDEAQMAELEAQVRADAARQTAIEGEMTQSLKHLRDSVGSIRLEMMRIEQEADRMVRYMEAGRAYVGRTLQEQSDLFEVLLGEDEPMTG